MRGSGRPGGRTGGLAHSAQQTMQSLRSHKNTRWIILPSANADPVFTSHRRSSFQQVLPTQVLQQQVLPTSASGPLTQLGKPRTSSCERGLQALLHLTHHCRCRALRLQGRAVGSLVQVLGQVQQAILNQVMHQLSQHTVWEVAGIVATP